MLTHFYNATLMPRLYIILILLYMFFMLQKDEILRFHKFLLMNFYKGNFQTVKPQAKNLNQLTSALFQGF